MPTTAIPYRVVCTGTRRMHGCARRYKSLLDRLWLSMRHDFRPSDAHSSLAIDTVRIRLYRSVLSFWDGTNYLLDIDSEGTGRLVNRWRVSGLENISLEELGLCKRTRQFLEKLEIPNAKHLTSETEEELLRIRGFGTKMLAEVVERLATLDLALPTSLSEVDPRDRHIRHFVGVLTECGCVGSGGWLAACKAGITTYGDLVDASEGRLAEVFGAGAAYMLKAAA